VLVHSNDTHHRLFAANVGDSRVNLVCLQQNNINITKRLSYDHRADDDQERRRLLDGGFLVLNGRVRGTLQLSRAFGDRDFDKRREVLVDPFVSQPITIERNRHHNDSSSNNNSEQCFVVIASDGFWDVVNDENLATELKRWREDNVTTQQMATEYVNRAVALQSTDNVSVILIKLL
jgi:serine/threonine protein phosphatase PrpC